MAYAKHTWVDGTEDDPGKGTTVKATWMNEIEDELETLENDKTELKDSLTELSSTLRSTLTLNSALSVRGSNYAIKVGTAVFIHLSFITSSDGLEASSTIAELPEDCWPKSTVTNYGILNITSTTVSAFTVSTNGTIQNVSNLGSSRIIYGDIFYNLK